MTVLTIELLSYTYTSSLFSEVNSIQFIPLTHCLLHFPRLSTLITSRIMVVTIHTVLAKRKLDTNSGVVLVILQVVLVVYTKNEQIRNK